MKLDKFKNMLENENTRKVISSALNVIVTLGSKGKQYVDDYNPQRTITSKPRKRITK